MFSKDRLTVVVINEHHWNCEEHPILKCTSRKVHLSHCSQKPFQLCHYLTFISRHSSPSFGVHPLRMTTSFSSTLKVGFVVAEVANVNSTSMSTEYGSYCNFDIFRMSNANARSTTQLTTRVMSQWFSRR